MKKKRLQIIEEIKKIERELYLKKSRLAASEALEYGFLSVVLFLKNC